MRNPGLRQSDAAARLASRRRISWRSCDELERRSLLQRSRSKADRRSYALHLRLRTRCSARARLHDARVAPRRGSVQAGATTLLLLRRLAGRV